MDNGPDPSDDLTSAQVELEAIDTANESQESLTDVEVPLCHSARESQAPSQLIEELYLCCYCSITNHDYSTFNFFCSKVEGV